MSWHLDMTDIFPGRLAILQRVLPFYRVPFFSSLARNCPAGMELFAGMPRPGEAIETADHFDEGRYIQTHNIHLLKGSLYACLQPGVLAWLEKFQPDVLIVEANPRYLSTPAAVRWMHARNHPVIGWGLGAPPMHGLFSNNRSQSRKKFLNQLDAMIAYSQQGADEYAACGFSRSKIFIAPNSAAFKPLSVPDDKPDNWIGKPQILFVGRLQARKRLDLLFKACALLPKETQPEITIVGDGPDREQIEEAAQAAYPEVIFTGTKTGIELDPYYQKADLFVLPGTGGLAVQQAMTYGLPVIVAAGDGTQSQMVRPENGWIISPDNLDDLTKTLQAALSDPLGLRKKGLESYRIVRDEINIEKMVEVFISAINSVSKL
jgi:glycosyltransferase involved in cell wall biosynthesis